MASFGYRRRAGATAARVWATWAAWRRGVLAGTAALAMLLAGPQAALANCTVAGSATPSGTNSVSCAANTTTTNTTNIDGATANSIAATQQFNFNGDVSASISAGVTVGGEGLFIQQLDGNGALIVTNNGAVTSTTGTGLLLSTNGGLITYSGNGNVTGVGQGNGLSASANGGGSVSVNTGTGTITAFGFAALQASATGAGTMSVTTSGTVSSAEAGIKTTATDGQTTINVNGGSVGSPSQGLWVRSSGTGAIDVSIATGATVSGQIGLLVDGGTGATNITVLGTLSSPLNTAADFRGTLTVGNGGTSGTLAGNVIMQDSATRLKFDRSDAVTFGGVISGAGALETLGAGTLTLTGASTHTGGTTISAGAALQIGNGSTTGSVLGNITNNAALTFNRSNAVSFGGVISGSGTLGKLGAGRLTLSGTQTYTGATTVSGGTLAVNGSILASSGVTINSGGALGGTGTVGNTTIASGGALAPGNSIGTLNVTGNVAFNAGSFFDVEVNAAGGADLLLATGAATITGGTVRVSAEAGTYAASTSYTILTANTRTGTFSGATSNLAFLTPTLTYDAQNVMLRLDRNDINFAEAATSQNQRAVADAAEALGVGNPIHDAIIGLSDAEAQAAYNALSGEGHATIKGMLVENSNLVLDALLGRLQTLRSAPETTGAVSGYFGEPLLSGESAYAGRLWGQLYGGVGSRAGDGNAAASSFGGGGLVLGTETEIDDWQLGFSAQVGSSGFSIPDRATTGTSADVGLGVYGGTQWGDTGFGFGASFTRSGIATTRQVQFPGFSETLTARYGATTGQLFAEINHEFEWGDVSLTPFAQLAYSGTATDAFTEQGGASALSSSANLINSTFATLGLRAEHEFLFGEDGLGTVSGGVAWRHGFVAAPVASNSFAGGGAFTASGAPAGSDALVLEAGLSLDLANGLDVSLDYAGQISTQGQSHGLSARLGGAF